MQPWTPETTGGIAETGILGVPWLLLTLYVGIAVALAWVIHALRGGTLRGTDGVVATLRRGPASHERTLVGVVLLPILILWVPYFTLIALRGWDPVWAIDPAAPGPQVAEIRSDGIWRSDAIEHASSWTWTAGEPCVDACPGPRYIYRIQPGETFTFVITVRNDGPLPITLLGRPPTPTGSGRGLALLRDPGMQSAEPSNLVPFAPVQLSVGSTIPVGLVLAAPACADPAGDVPHGDPNAYSYTGYPFVYEVAGWRRIGYAWPHLTISIAGCPN